MQGICAFIERGLFAYIWEEGFAEQQGVCLWLEEACVNVEKSNVSSAE